MKGTFGITINPVYVYIIYLPGNVDLEIIAGDQNFEPLHIRTFSVRNKFLCYQRTQFPPVGPDSYRDRAVKKINHEIG
jgi:hypothetical protein